MTTISRVKYCEFCAKRINQFTNYCYECELYSEPVFPDDIKEECEPELKVIKYKTHIDNDYYIENNTYRLYIDKIISILTKSRSTLKSADADAYMIDFINNLIDSDHPDILRGQILFTSNMLKDYNKRKYTPDDQYSSVLDDYIEYLKGYTLIMLFGEGTDKQYDDSYDTYYGLLNYKIEMEMRYYNKIEEVFELYIGDKKTNSTSSYTSDRCNINFLNGILDYYNYGKSQHEIRINEYNTLKQQLFDDKYKL